MAIQMSTIYVDTPTCKVFDVTAAESDPIDTEQAFVWLTSGFLYDLRGNPDWIIVQNVTTNTLHSMGAIAIPAISTTGLTVLKTSVASANATKHSHRIYAIIKRAYEV